MAHLTVLIKHKTLPGKREEVRSVWEKHMAPAISANTDHLEYYYCFDNDDPNTICAFQQYTNAEAAKAFLETEHYSAYLKDVEPFLAGTPEITNLSTMWSKSGAKQSL